MLECLSFKSSTSSSTVPNPSQEDTPSISREYNLAVHTTSYTEIRSNVEAQAHHLNPTREHVQEALTTIKTPSPLISTFFDHTETASDLCLTLHQCLLRARELHAPLLDLFQTFDPAHPTQTDCDRALRLFHPFDTVQNPIPDFHTFSAVRASLSSLKTQLDRRVAKSLSRLRVFRRALRGSTLCLVAVAIAVVAATVAATVHAVAAMAAGAAAVPACASEKRELAKLRQLDAAAKCAYVLSNDLGTIDALVSRLRAAVEGDKVLVRLGLERGGERYLVQEVIKQLWKSHQGFMHQVEDLEEHIILCFYNINKARLLAKGQNYVLTKRNYGLYLHYPDLHALKTCMQNQKYVSLVNEAQVFLDPALLDRSGDLTKRGLTEHDPLLSFAFQISKTLAAIVGGTAGLVALVGMIVVLIWFCLSHNRSVSRTSETGSSDPSQGRKKLNYHYKALDALRWKTSLATKEFSEKILIGEWKLWEVYRVLLCDGVLVAIKRHALPTQEFVDEGAYQGWLIFTLWAPSWYIKISKQPMFLWMKTSLLRSQMQDYVTFFGRDEIAGPSSQVFCLDKLLNQLLDKLLNMLL
ncbi:UPF0496 protein, partial [Mucuna pruriens]